MAIICFLPYAQGDTVSIGTASARGDMRVNSYPVNGNATLFDGSVIETGQATADVRLAHGVEITLSTASRSTLFRDHIELQQGKTEIAGPKSFQVEANGLRVTPNTANSRGVVSIKSATIVEVAALAGGFGITDAKGTLLATVRPGQGASLDLGRVQDSHLTANAEPVSGEGVVETEGGHYFVNVDGLKYEIVGEDFKQYVGTKVALKGSMPDGGSTIMVSSLGVDGGGSDKNGGAVEAASSANFLGISGRSWLLIGAIVVAAGGWSYGIYEANQSPTPASR